jgi:pimeloyl-ACP methyl ester carboxylesterase
MRSLKISVALVAAYLTTACSGLGQSDSEAFYEATSCPKPNIAGFPALDFPANAQCGYLSVLEDRAKPEGRRIRIFVTRVPAVSATPKPDPIVYLSGGPGGAGSFEVAFMVGHGINAERDVIFVDQRGTHHADPVAGLPGVRAVHLRRSQYPLRGGFDHRDRCRVGQGVPRPPGGHGASTSRPTTAPRTPPTSPS